MTSCPSEGHSGVPQRRFADPGGSLQEQAGGWPQRRPDEGLHLGELGVPPEDSVNRLLSDSTARQRFRSYGERPKVARALTA
jgi:hypothetical protein